MLYSTFTAYLGFQVNEGEYKVMGLASYGTPRYREEVSRMVKRLPGGGFALDLRSFSDAFVEMLGPPRDPHVPIELPEGQRYADVAASVQWLLEDLLLEIARE